jgi:hypothetical protein
MMTADNALASKAAAGGAASKPPRSNRKKTSKISPIESELPDIQNRTLTNSFNSARRKDTISELDLSSGKQADGGDLRKTTKRSSLPKVKLPGGNQTNGNLFPDIVNQQPTQRNNLMGGTQMDKTLYSNHTNDNAKYASKNKDAFDVQSLHSSASGSQLFDQN